MVLIWRGNPPGRLEADASIPSWALTGELTSMTRALDELSIVCCCEEVPAGIRCEIGYRYIKVKGPVDFALTEILVSLTRVLAQKGIRALIVSLFYTDHILVKEARMKSASQASLRAGHNLRN